MQKFVPMPTTYGGLGTFEVVSLHHMRCMFKQQQQLLFFRYTCDIGGIFLVRFWGVFLILAHIMSYHIPIITGNTAALLRHIRSRTICNRLTLTAIQRRDRTIPQHSDKNRYQQWNAIIEDQHNREMEYFWMIKFVVQIRFNWKIWIISRVSHQVTRFIESFSRDQQLVQKFCTKRQICTNTCMHTTLFQIGCDNLYMYIIYQYTQNYIKNIQQNNFTQFTYPL
eukprot:TRINITY_DN4652_c1_g2_i2.p2 TRINITY_DN4652_c1_g2~~TRINITY_DN4652_c1_g2_i2.p2  ORF type:complete len:224 (+),score=-18.05 TRINITY_DN4652_c1_g2_i2:976-1647(+)